MSEEKGPGQPSLYRETQRPDFQIGTKRDEPGKKQGSGVFYMILGLAFGLVGASRVITLIPAAWSIVAGDGSETSTLQESRTQIAVGIVAGLASVICSELGTRRERGRILWLGMIGSVLGIFAVMVGAALAVLLFTEAN